MGVVAKDLGGLVVLSPSPDDSFVSLLVLSVPSYIFCISLRRLTRVRSLHFPQTAVFPPILKNRFKQLVPSHSSPFFHPLGS